MQIAEVDFYQLVKPRAGYMQAGDMVFFEEDELTIKLAIIDGVGHGGPAHEVAVMARLYFIFNSKMKFPICQEKIVLLIYLGF